MVHRHPTRLDPPLPWTGADTQGTEQRPGASLLTGQQGDCVAHAVPQPRTLVGWLVGSGSGNAAARAEEGSQERDIRGIVVTISMTAHLT